ncbi:MAG: MotA/TolQ/ExbB proton channel family protein [Gammaproteobacteria bacterium]|nr:MotA/TolQ/ExbB proton channel family protein [Gammaproteobacteria bacterium]MBU1481524.1 MotA/TolQ/ExbB proton channel family protein [Gammaproteobacteria bacterium]
MGFIDSIVSFFISGGFWMYPILLAGSIGLSIGIERFFKLSKEERSNRKIWEQLHPAMVAGDFDAAREMLANNKTSVSRLLEAGLERQGTVRRRDDIEIAMEEGMMEIIPQLEKRINYIALYANLSTLLGLLGTIIGLIAAFNAVANANPAEKADLLSASISVAMNTTAFGLITAIPLLIIHSFLNSKAGSIVDSLEMISVKTLNIISASARKGSQPQ